MWFGLETTIIMNSVVNQPMYRNLNKNWLDMGFDVPFPISVALGLPPCDWQCVPFLWPEESRGTMNWVQVCCWILQESWPLCRFLLCYCFWSSFHSAWLRSSFVDVLRRRSLYRKRTSCRWFLFGYELMIPYTSLYHMRCRAPCSCGKPWGGQTLLSEAVNHPDATAQTLHGIKFGEARKAMTTTEEQAHKRSKGS